jgi:hypothetical protein
MPRVVQHLKFVAMEAVPAVCGDVQNHHAESDCKQGENVPARRIPAIGQSRVLLLCEMCAAQVVARRWFLWCS